jgi:dTDP-glucose 4,6-dehydratase
VTGGAGFIGGAVVRRLLEESEALVFNLDKCGYASDLTSIEALPRRPGATRCCGWTSPTPRPPPPRCARPTPIWCCTWRPRAMWTARSRAPAAFIDSNVSGTFHLLQAVRAHWEQLPTERQAGFRFHHISTDEVFGSLGATGRFSETTPYDPRSPYSASKAASDHLVNAWHHTYGLPVVLTNCSNNYGPWQFPEKLIPVVILKAAAGEPIPLYGDGQNVRDWLYVDDHVDALLLAACRGELGRSYCVGGHGERTNKEVVEAICNALDQLRPAGAPHARLITPVSDRPGHDRRYAIDPTRISTELGWQPRHSFEAGLAATVRWYLEQQAWCEQVRQRGGYGGARLGLVVGSQTTA